MAEKPINIYLNDHLAGSVAALQILESLEKRKSGTPMQRKLAELKNEVLADRRELEALMALLNISESRTRRTAAWLSEKLVELKALVDDPTEQLYFLEALDTLSMGIEGRALLWRSLEAAARVTPVLQVLDYDRLIRRAEEQRDQVEKMRLEAAMTALAGTV